MLRIDRDPNPFHPDRAKAEVISKPLRTNNSIVAAGGAFRSDGRWYSLSYICRTNPDQMKIVYFSYHVGSLILKNDWSKLGLWQ